MTIFLKFSFVRTQSIDIYGTIYCQGNCEMNINLYFWLLLYNDDVFEYIFVCDTYI